jgi:cell division protein FtsQ
MRKSRTTTISLKRKGNRFRKKPRSMRWRRLLGRCLWGTMALISLAMLTGLACMVGQALVASDYFRVREVRVENQRRISREDILALSDIRAGSNIFELDLERIGEAIEANPWIASAQVSRVFPDQVHICVQERQPRAIVRLDYLYYLDASGEIFKMLEHGDRLDFPVISGIDRQELLDRPARTRCRLGEALSLLDNLAARSVFGLKQVSELLLDDRAGIILYTCRGGVPVRIGRSAFGTKLDQLERIYPDLKTRLTAIEYIDLNVAQRVIVKLDAGDVRGKG